MSTQPVDLDAFDDPTDLDLGEDVDEIAVERRISGDRTVRLNRDETCRALEILTGRGLSDSTIAATLGCSESLIARWAGGYRPRGLASGRPVAPAEAAVIDRSRTQREMLACRKGCGKQCKGGTGRASHERVCDGPR